MQNSHMNYYYYFGKHTSEGGKSEKPMRKNSERIIRLEDPQKLFEYNDKTHPSSKDIWTKYHLSYYAGNKFQRKKCNYNVSVKTVTARNKPRDQRSAIIPKRNSTIQKSDKVCSYDADTKYTYLRWMKQNYYLEDEHITWRQIMSQFYEHNLWTNIVRT